MNNIESGIPTDPTETDAALHELTGGTFHDLSPEDAAVIAEWGKEARDAHVAAQAANVGQTALHEAASVEVGSAEDDDQLVTVGGNITVTRGALRQYEQRGEDMTGPYSGNRRA